MDKKWTNHLWANLVVDVGPNYFLTYFYIIFPDTVISLAQSLRIHDPLRTSLPTFLIRIDIRYCNCIV